jgi:hypothetical protein
MHFPIRNLCSGLLLLAAGALTAQPCNEDNNMFHNAVTLIGFSPDNSLFAMNRLHLNLEVWNLRDKTMPVCVPMEDHCGGGYWSPDGSKLLLNYWEELQGGKTRPYVYILDVKSGKGNQLPENDKHSYRGLITNESAWYLDDKNKLGTATLSAGSSDITSKDNWSVQLPGNVKEVLYVAQEKRFLVFTFIDDNMQGFTISSGDAAPSPMPKAVNKAIKKTWVWKTDKAAVLFKIMKQESALLMDVHTLQCTPAFTNALPDVNKQASFNMSEYWTESWDASEMGENFFCKNYSGSYLPKSIKLNNAFERFCFSDDLSKMVTFRKLGADLSLKNENSMMLLYDLTKPDAPAVEYPRPLRSDLAKFIDFIATHKDTFERFVQRHLRDDYFSRGWELVPDTKPIDAATGSINFPLDENYQYIAYRIGYDMLYRMYDGEVPGDEQPSMLTFSAGGQDRYVWNSKTVNWGYLGMAAEQYFHSTFPLQANVQFAYDKRNKIMSNLPGDAVRVYILRRKGGNGFDSGSYSYDTNRQERQTYANSSSYSSSSSSSPCKSADGADADYAKLKAGRDDLESDPAFETVASEVGTGLVSQSFYAPDYTGVIRVAVFTSSPCNELVIYNTTANTFEAAKKHVTSGSSMGKSSAFRKSLESSKLYYAEIEIDSKAGSRTKFQATVRNANGGTTEGATYIWVFHSK